MIEEKKKKDLVACLKEAETYQKTIKACLKHVEIERDQLKEKLSKKRALEVARREIMDLKV